MTKHAHQFGVDVASKTAAQQLQRDHVAAPSESYKPLPAPTGTPPYRLALGDVTKDPTNQLVFHVIGDHGGVKDPTPQQAVAGAMIADAAANGVSFLFSVGDVVYFNGDASEYLPQFYEPYDTYPHPIFAIPGNHDGDNSDNPAVPSLDSFVRNFCSKTPAVTQDAGDMHRTSMTQPNVYWTLNAALATIIGCYSNVPSGGVIATPQTEWITSELAAAPTDRPLILALHHPPYSIDAHHGGSAAMGALIDAACKEANVWPDLVLAGHVHDYQRFTRHDTPHPITYVVSGNGGYHNLHAFAGGISPGQEIASGVTYEGGIDHQWGFLRLAIAAGKITGAAYGLDRTGPATMVDQWEQAVA